MAWLVDRAGDLGRRYFIDRVGRQPTLVEQLLFPSDRDGLLIHRARTRAGC